MNNQKSKIVIIGGGGHARVIYSIIRKSKTFDYLGYIDIKKDNTLPDFLGNDEFALGTLEKGQNIVIGISYVNSIYDTIRKEIIEKYVLSNMFNYPSIISENSIIEDDVKIGSGTVIVNGATANTGTVIGEFCVVNTNATIDHNCRIGRNTQIAPGAVILGDVSIGDDVFIGAGSIVLDGVNISNNIIVGAGSLVTNNLLEAGVYVGRPVRKIRKL